MGLSSVILPSFCRVPRVLPHWHPLPWAGLHSSSKISSDRSHFFVSYHPPGVLHRKAR